MNRLLILFALLISCKGQQKTEFIADYKMPGPQTIVYKTKKDYYNLVPVLLSDDKTEIISYPHPIDIKVGDTYVTPTKLNEGYLLDNRGIGKNVAFLNMTYEQYSKLDRVPTLEELQNMIVDKNPLEVMCNCGNKKAFSDIKKELNVIIDSKKLLKICKQIK
jgi:hypothetical protein